MENAGCITVNDIYIYKDKVSLEKITWVAIVIAHELAHMVIYIANNLFLNFKNIEFSGLVI